MLLLIYCMSLCGGYAVKAYSIKHFTITKARNTESGAICFVNEQNRTSNDFKSYEYFYDRVYGVTSHWNTSIDTRVKYKEEDPMLTFRDVIYKFLFGEGCGVKDMIERKKINNRTVLETGNLSHYPTGRALRKAELFNGKVGVHYPITELMYTGHCMLRMTDDFMQTAVDAFAIFVNGNLADIMRLPADYVLNSARTISMLKISHEKLAATWKLVKGSRDPVEVTYETLDKYRPLFKYLSGTEMARLNLSDHRILNYIGTHPDIDRHQVGLVASKYIKLNKMWWEPMYLNSMNNLLCGMPITYMRDIPENIYLQLSHQIFYHTRACDPIQRRFYLSMMTKTQALGKSYSWNAQDVARLGLLLAEVEGEDLGSIKPEALAGLTAQVVMEMRPANLQYLTDVQLKYVGEKPFNILAKKLKRYKEQLSAAVKHAPVLYIVILNTAMELYTVKSMYKYLK